MCISIPKQALIKSYWVPLKLYFLTTVHRLRMDGLIQEWSVLPASALYSLRNKTANLNKFLKSSITWIAFTVHAISRQLQPTTQPTRQNLQQPHPLLEDTHCEEIQDVSVILALRLFSRLLAHSLNKWTKFRKENRTYCSCRIWTRNLRQTTSSWWPDSIEWSTQIPSKSVCSSQTRLNAFYFLNMSHCISRFLARVSVLLYESYSSSTTGSLSAFFQKQKSGHLAASVISLVLENLSSSDLRTKDCRRCCICLFTESSLLNSWYLLSFSDTCFNWVGLLLQLRIN